MATDAHVSNMTIELVLSSNAIVAPPNSPGTSSSVWIPFITNTTDPGAGKNSLAIALNDNQTLDSSVGWYGKWIYSALMPCSFPNNLIWGGQWNWEFASASPFLMTMRIGILLYDVNFTFLSEIVTDYAGSSGTNAWAQIPETITPIPTEAAFFRFECVALVAGSGNTGIGNNYATMLFDNLYAIQQIGTTAAPGGGGGTTTTTIVTTNVVPTVSLNGWGANGHVGSYEHGTSQGYFFGLDSGTTQGYQNPENAIDGDPTTSAAVTLQHTHAYAGCVWAFPAGPTNGVSTLVIDSSIPANGAVIITARSAGIWYSLDGGTTWKQIYNTNVRARKIDSIQLPPGQDLSLVQVMAFTDAHDDMAHRVWEINITNTTSVQTVTGGSTTGSTGGTTGTGGSTGSGSTGGTGTGGSGGTGGTTGTGKTVTSRGGHLSYSTSVGGHITWTWTGVTLFWSDGSTTIVPDGSITQNGLIDAALYYYFPYVDLATGMLKWVDGGMGTA